MHLQRVNFLIEKLVAGSISSSEQDELFIWYKEVAEQEFVSSETEEEIQIRIFFRLMESTGYNQQLAFKKRNIKRIWYGVIAAVASMLLIGFVMLYNLKSPSEVNLQYVEHDGKPDYMPGGNRALLRMEDGEVIALSTSKTGIQMDKGLRYTDGDGLGASLALQPDQVQQLQLIIPRGGIYQVILSDGSKIWLNANSTLTYPSQFLGAARTVSLEGEAYFEISKNRKPFIVKTAQQEVNVLGTKFNVSSYSNRNEERITLVEGSIQVKSPFGAYLLHPNQELITDAHKSFQQDADAEDAIAWKGGIFLFDNMKLADVLLRLADWYNVDFEFKDERLKSELIFAIVKRSDQISVVLQKIADTDVAAFDIQKTKIIVRKKRN